MVWIQLMQKKSFYLIDARKYQTVLEPSISLSNLLHRIRVFLVNFLGLFVNLTPRPRMHKKRVKSHTEKPSCGLHWARCCWESLHHLAKSSTADARHKKFCSKALPVWTLCYSLIVKMSFSDLEILSSVKEADNIEKYGCR